MAYIDCNIDTKPMAESLRHVAHHVDATTTAVTAMQAAVIKAHETSADRVCHDVNRGFYSLIHSQISQKIAKWQAEVDSLLLQLNQQRRQLASIRNRMEHDYGMLTQRYSKLFGSLNRALQRRVYELDKPAFRFAVTEMDTLQNRGRQLTAAVPVSQSESVASSQKIMTSNIKYRANRLIDVMKAFLLDTGHQKALTANTLIDRQITTPGIEQYIPVILWQGVAGKNEGTLDHVISPIELPEHTRTQITRGATSAETPLAWSEMTAAPQEEVTRAFHSIMASYDATDRIKDTMNRLFDAAKYSTASTPVQP